MKCILIMNTEVKFCFEINHSLLNMQFCTYLFNITSKLKHFLLLKYNQLVFKMDIVHVQKDS